jgi:hypothetical protein
MRGSRFGTTAPSFRGSRTHVGASALQTPGAIRSEMQKIDDEIGATDAELSAQAKRHGVTEDYHLSTGWQTSYDGDDKLAQFYVDAWVPFRKAWHDWYSDNKPPTFLSRPLSWLGSLAWNEAPTAEAYQRNLVGMRETARKLGYALHSPDPDVEGMSFADPRRAGVGDAIDAIAKVAKVGLWGGLALGGVFAVAKIVEVSKGSGSGRRR